MPKNKIAVVTGANRGIGFEVSRQLAKKGDITIILTARNKEKGEEAFRHLKEKGLDVVFRMLDVSDSISIRQFCESVKNDYGRIDILVNNAGIFIDTKNASDPDFPSIFSADTEKIQDTFQTNTLGPFLLSQQFVPLMKKNNYGRIVNLSSGMGQLTGMNRGYVGYRLSKVALNALTRIFSEELNGTNILVNSMCPGWVKTDMGGRNATRSIEEGADTVVWLATLPDGGPTGKFFRDRKEIAW